MMPQIHIFMAPKPVEMWILSPITYIKIIFGRPFMVIMNKVHNYMNQ